jgi:hypothetical protein
MDNDYLRWTAKEPSLYTSWPENIITQILHLDALKPKNKLSSFWFPEPTSTLTITILAITYPHSNKCDSYSATAKLKKHDTAFLCIAIIRI